MNAAVRSGAVVAMARAIFRSRAGYDVGQSDDNALDEALWFNAEAYAAAAWEALGVSCPNCDDRGCVTCVLRDVDHVCTNDCPNCEAPRDDDYGHSAFTFGALLRDVEP